MYLQNNIEKMSEKMCKLYKFARYAFIRPYKILTKTRNFFMITTNIYSWIIKCTYVSHEKVMY